MEVSAEWILGSFLALAGIIGTMAKLIYNALHSQIESLKLIIRRLQDDVDRLSAGCGIGQCLWKNRDAGTFTGSSARPNIEQDNLHGEG